MAEDKREPTRALDKASRVMDALAAENGLSPALNWYAWNVRKVMPSIR